MELPEYVIDKSPGVFHVFGRRQTGKTSIAKRLVKWARGATLVEDMILAAPTALPSGPIIFENAFWTYDVLNEVSKMAAAKTAPVVMTFGAPGLVGDELAMPKALFLLQENGRALRREAYETWRPLFGTVTFESLDVAWDGCAPTTRCLVVSGGVMYYLGAAKRL
jgi:hypothetical protein